MRLLLKALAGPIADCTGENQLIVGDMIADRRERRICDRMIEADQAKPSSIAPRHVRVEAFCVLGAYDASRPVEDFTITKECNFSHPRAVTPDEALAALFEGANVSFPDYRAWVLENHGIGLCAKPRKRPALLTPKNIDTIIEESHDGGLPVYVCRMRLADMLSNDWDQPLLMRPV